MMELSEKDLKATIISVFHEIKVNTLEMMERQFSEKQNHIKELNGISELKNQYMKYTFTEWAQLQA